MAPDKSSSSLAARSLSNPAVSFLRRRYTKGEKPPRVKVKALLDLVILNNYDFFNPPMHIFHSNSLCLLRLEGSIRYIYYIQNNDLYLKR